MIEVEIRIISSWIFFLLGIIIDDSDRYIPRILIGSFFGVGVIWVSFRVNDLSFCLLLSIMSLVFCELIKILFKERNCDVVLRSCCVVDLV